MEDIREVVDVVVILVVQRSGPSKILFVSQSMILVLVVERLPKAIKANSTIKIT